MPFPYSFPHETRADMVAYLTDRRARSYHYRRYLFCWNVKTYGAAFDGASLRKHFHNLNPAYDSAWDSHVAANDDLFYLWCEDAARYIAEGEWTSYPGDDQGDWTFSFAGRSGGWLVLEKWRGRDVRDLDPAELADPEEWSDEDLTAFYRGIRVADSDFAPDNAAAEVEYHAAFHREQWEDERRQEAEDAAFAMAEALAESRPDLAPCY